MALLSLFATSTGVFCFVPISQRLVESGIGVPAWHNWWFRGLPGALAPALHDGKKDRLALLLAADNPEAAWSHPKIPLYAARDPNMFATDRQPETLIKDKWPSMTTTPQAGASTTPSPIATLYSGHESASFTSESTLCNNCDVLLRREIPPDHIPSVIRALALLEAQDHLSGVVYGEYEMAALTDAFAMLRI